jgi:hypothetical protein
LAICSHVLFSIAADKPLLTFDTTPFGYKTQVLLNNYLGEVLIMGQQYF